MQLRNVLWGVWELGCFDYSKVWLFETAIEHEQTSLISVVLPAMLASDWGAVPEFLSPNQTSLDKYLEEWAYL